MENETRAGSSAFRVINNSAAFFGGEFLYHLINFFAAILIARSLGGAHYGEFSFIFIYLSFFELFTQFGLNPVLTRELSRRPEEAPKILGNAILLRLALIGVALTSAFLLIQLLGYSVSVQQGVFLAAFQLFLTLRSIYETFFRAKLLVIYPALWNGFRALLNLAFVAAVTYTHPRVFSFILCYLVSGTVGLGGLAFFTRRFIRPQFRPDWKLLRYLIQESSPLLLSSYLTLLYCKIDILMLSKMKSFWEVGYYSVATRLVEPLDMIAGSLTVSLLPLLSRAFQENRREFEILSAKAFLGILLVTLPLALAGGLVAQDLILFFFGETYRVSGITLAILLWYTFFGSLATLLVNLLVATGKQTVDVGISFFLILLNVTLNLFLIPRFSYNGAAWATVLTEVTGTSLMLVYLGKHPAIRLFFPRGDLFTALKVNGIFFLLLLCFKLLGMPSLVLIFFGLLSYACLLLGLRILTWAGLKNYFFQWAHWLEGVRK